MKKAKPRKRAALYSCIAAAATILITAGAFMASAESAEIQPQIVTPNTVTPAAKTTAAKAYQARHELTAEEITASYLKSAVKSLTNQNVVAIEIDNDTVYFPVVKNAAGEITCQLCNSADDTLIAELSESSDFETIVNQLTPEDHQYYISANLNTASAYCLDDSGAVIAYALGEETQSPACTPELEYNVKLGTIHIAAGSIKSNAALSQLGQDFDVATADVNGTTVYIPLVKNAAGEIKYKLCQSIDGTPDTFIRVVDEGSSKTGWASALENVSDDYQYYLAADFDFASAYTIDSDGNHIPFELAN